MASKTPTIRRPSSTVHAPGFHVVLIEETFALLVPQGEALVLRFYAELLQRYLDVKRLFPLCSM